MPECCSNTLPSLDWTVSRDDTRPGVGGRGMGAEEGMLGRLGGNAGMWRGLEDSRSRGIGRGSIWKVWDEVNRESSMC